MSIPLYKSKKVVGKSVYEKPLKATYWEEIGLYIKCNAYISG